MFNFSYFNDKHKFANIELDALISQSITLKNIVSSHPIENGDLLNDAVHNEPIKISFSAVISDMPQDAIEQLSSVADVLGAIFSSSTTSSKSMKGWLELYDVWKSKTLVSVSSPIQGDLFEDMMILQIRVDVDNTESLTFYVDLQNVVIAKNLQVQNLAPEVGKQSVRP